MTALIDLRIEAGDWGALQDADALAEQAARAVMAEIGLAEIGLAAEGYEIAALLTDDDGIARLNADFRGKPQPTNVLSWPAFALRPGDAPPPPPAFLGDLALAAGVLAREAAAQKLSLQDHFQHLIAHGVLHLLGFDHISDQDAERMEGLERRALDRIGVADPYQ